MSGGSETTSARAGRPLAVAGVAVAAAAALWIVASAGSRATTIESLAAERAERAEEDASLTPPPPPRMQRPTVPTAGETVGVAVAWQQPAPPLQPLSQAELLAKAGEKDGDTTYTRLLEEVFEHLPGLEEPRKEELRYIARKRQSQLKSKLFDQPELGKQLGIADEDDLTPVERQLLGETSYQLYRTKMAEIFQN